MRFGRTDRNRIARTGETGMGGVDYHPTRIRRFAGGLRAAEMGAGDAY